MFALFAAVGLYTTPAQTASGQKSKSTADKVVAGTCDQELALARTFVELGDYKNAEIHFSIAAKGKKCQQQGLDGIKVARANEEAPLLHIGQIYESNHQWSKAEDLYRVTALDSSVKAATRNIASERLKSVLQAQTQEMRWSRLRDSVSEWVRGIAAVTVFFLSLVLLIFTVRSIWRHRRIILIHPFDAPTDELAKGLNIQLRYARITMNNPAFSNAAQIPPFLIENLKFSDEVEPIDDLEIAGSKIPFSSIERLFGQPSVRVTGGFDGVGPVGNAYSIVQTHDSSADAFIRRQIRIGVDNEQRLDLLDFAYDVIIKASSAYADV
jgi:hypothetical protein